MARLLAELRTGFLLERGSPTAVGVAGGLEERAGLLQQGDSAVRAGLCKQPVAEVGELDVAVAAKEGAGIAAHAEAELAGVGARE